MILTIRLRLKDKHAAELNRQAAAVNVVWNYCNDTQQKAAQTGREWLTWMELAKLTAGSSRLLDLNSHTIHQTCIRYVVARQQHRKPWMRFRSTKSLGWVPFNQTHVRFDGEAFVFRRKRYVPMHTRCILREGATIYAGSFNRDARGRWYINAPVELEPTATVATGRTNIGVDLGLADLATLSTGEKIANPRHFASLEATLATAHRAHKRRRARAVHAKIVNARRDSLHKASARIASAHTIIFVGDVSSKTLARTNLGKSVLDAGWSTFRKYLSYKAIRHGGQMIEVDERWTTQTCSSCGSLPPERPLGIAGLGIREWTCGACGVSHDRDVNAARNILARGLASLAEGAAQCGAANPLEFSVASSSSAISPQTETHTHVYP